MRQATFGSGFVVPYTYSTTGTLACAAGVSFRIDWTSSITQQRYSACAPCDAVAVASSRVKLCSIMLGDAWSYSGCKATVAGGDTMNTVCQQCVQMPYATLLTTTQPQYASFPLPTMSDGSQPKWPCRYSCSASEPKTYINTYTNNNYLNYVGTGYNQVGYGLATA